MGKYKLGAINSIFKNELPKKQFNLFKYVFEYSTRMIILPKSVVPLYGTSDFAEIKLPDTGLLKVPTS